MVSLAVSKGQSKNLPGGTQLFTVGVGWDAKGGGDSPDLDIWVIRKNNGIGEPVCWANGDLLRPDLGTNSEGKPYIATPELDVIHQGDDTTGASSDGGYDEIVKLDLGKAPASVSGYDVIVTFFEEPPVTGKTLGMADNIVCGVVDESTSNELKTQLGDEFGFDVTAHICSIVKDPTTGKWAMQAVHEGHQEGIMQLLDKFGVSTS